MAISLRSGCLLRSSLSILTNVNVLFGYLADNFVVFKELYFKQLRLQAQLTRLNSADRYSVDSCSRLQNGFEH